jgi:hypothetical protein
VLWLVWSASLALVVLVQTVLGRYGDRASEAWQWLLPTITPITFLITGVVAADAFDPRPDPRMADAFAFRLAQGLSVFYLAGATITILASPFSPLPPLKLMQMSNLWLGPLQGIVAASIGVFFVGRSALMPFADGRSTDAGGTETLPPEAPRDDPQ